MGKECLQLFMNLKLSEENRNDLSKCVDAFEAYFKPKCNIVYERFQFNACVQNTRENVDSYVNRLRKLASSCDYGELTDQLIRDRLIIGLLDKRTQERLLKEPTLTLDKAVDLARASEIAKKQVESMKTEVKTTEENVHMLKKH